ncbi:MAG: hypothetical protein JSV92_01195 [archaeon]|nr:MAG: hypothetical protein JSV92_01195 [archaeon]
MTLKDALTYTWEKPAFNLVRKIYVRPGSPPYERNYEPEGYRRALHSRKVLDELEIPRYSSDLSALLNTTMGFLGVSNGQLDFFDLGEANYILKNENQDKIGKELWEEGKEWCKGLCRITPDDFSKGYNVLMILLDLVLGSLHHDLDHPEPGFAHYRFDEKTYPFGENSPSENMVWSFAQGAASTLHSKGGEEMNMHETITRKNGSVLVLSEAK